MNVRRRILPLALLSGAATLALAVSGVGASAANAAVPGAAHAAVASHSVSPGGGNADSDSYAYKHLCTPGQVRVKVVYDAKLGATKRLIEVTNEGVNACGLTYYPEVAIDDSSTINTRHGHAVTVQPRVPGGLGGAPAYPLYAKHTAYAVLDLDPSHAVTASRPYNEIGVIFNNGLPDADTLNFSAAAGPRTGNPSVKNPFLGLYESTVAAANASANPAHR